MREPSPTGATGLKSTITCDMEGRLETFNAGAEEIFGYSASEVIGKARVSLFSPGLTVLQNVPTWLSIARSTGKFEGESVFVRKDGSRFPAKIRITPTKKGGVQIGYCGVTTPLPQSELARVEPKIRLFTKIFSALVVSRAPFLSASIFPVLIAGAYVAQRAEFSWPAFLLALVGAASVHIAANTWNDMYDWQSGADKINHDYFLPYSGGSRAIELGLITERGLMKIAVGAIVVAFTCGLGIAALGSPVVLPLGLLGALAAWTYTAPPLRLIARRGLGELLIGVAFGPLLSVGAVAAVTGSIDPIAALLGIPVGLLTTAILWINEFPDAPSDALAGKNHLVVTMGASAARWGYVALIAVAFGTLVALVALGAIAPTALLALLTLPLAVRSTYILFREYRSRELVRANVGTIVLQGAFGFTLACGILIS
jgi:1,4-dihydroxy-2-naphthoate octaprenyltransferase